MLAFLLVAEGVIPVQAADTPTQYYNIQFQILDTQNKVYTYGVPAPTVIQQPPWKLNGTGPYISNAVGYQIGAQQDFEFDVIRICSEVAVITNTNQASVSVSGNHVSMQIMGPIIPGSTIYIVISGKHEPIANSIITQSSATCTTEGREIATCSKCYQQYVYKILPIDPNRHEKGIKTIDKDATCTEAGQYHYECEKCGAELSKKQTIPAKGHTWTDSGSGLVCSVCGKKSEAKASGMYYGIPWEMDAEGNLTLIGGTCTNVQGTKWKYRDVKTVKCNGEIICNNNFCTGLFQYTSNLVSADLSRFNTGNVTSMGVMFEGCTSLKSLDLSNFNTSIVYNMYYMFGSCSSLTSLNLSNFNTTNVTNMSRMFEGCSNLKSLDVSNFNTRNVTRMNSMFYYCKNLVSLDVSNFNTINVTNMSQMFYECYSLKSLDVSNFNTSNVTDLSRMFSDCKLLTSLNVSNFDTSNVTDISCMFEGCSSLKSLNLSNFNTSKVTSVYKMFLGCNKLEVLTTPNVVGTTDIDLPFTMYDKNNNEYNKITVTNTELYKEPQFKIFVNKTVRIKGIAIGSRRIGVSY